jgi:hypothetical protein
MSGATTTVGFDELAKDLLTKLARRAEGARRILQDI